MRTFFLRFLGSFATGTLSVIAIPMAAALGVGAGLQTNGYANLHTRAASANADIRAEARADARQNFGQFVKTLRMTMHDNRDLSMEIRAYIHKATAKFRVALQAQVKLAFDACKDKEGDARRACIADAKVKLDAKVAAAIDALSK